MPTRKPRRRPGEQQPDQPPEAAAGQPPAFEPLPVGDHRTFARSTAEILRRFNANPDLAALLFVNPAMALREIGVEPSPAITHHVLHTIQYPPGLRARREELVASLTEHLGAPPRPNDAAWTAETLFERLQLQPVDPGDRAPAYKPAIAPATMKQYQAMRPAARPAGRYPGRVLRSGSLKVATDRPSPRRMDLDAPLPALPPAAEPPREVPLELLYFYKDSHPVARELLELAIIERQAFPIQSSDSFRKIKRGEKRSAFRSWLGRISFPERGRDEPDS